jgi:hypothetical protein
MRTYMCLEAHEVKKHKFGNTTFIEMLRVFFLLLLLFFILGHYVVHFL